MLRSLLFWICLPFLLPQAISVRKNAPRFPGAGGPKEGNVGNGAPLDLIAIGDSIIAGVGARGLSGALVGQTAAHLADMMERKIRWQAYGSIGADSHKVLNRLVPQLPDAQAQIVILSVGVNDVTGLVRIPTWEHNLVRLLEILHNHSPEAIVAVAGIPPLRGFPLLPQPLRALFGLRGRTFDKAARRIVSQLPYAVYVLLDFEPTPDKFSADGYHPSEASYTVFGQMMAASISERFDAIAPGQDIPKREHKPPLSGKKS